MSAGKVYFVGAGPGDPDLLTQKALRILQTADVVLHDDLVTPEILALIRTPHVRSVGKRCGVKKISQEEIHAQLIAFARRELIVARLKGGDPLIFGRAGEEVEALREAGIEFEIVPGVTAVAAAAASAKIPLTDRRIASQLVLLSGCHCDDRGTIIGSAISPETTLAVHMPGTDYPSIARELCAAGLHESTPCVIVSCATRRDEKIVHTTLNDLPRIPPVASPALLIIGKVAAIGAETPVDSIEAGSGQHEIATPTP